MFRELHPRQPREPVENKDPTYGRNLPTPSYPERAWIRCTRCGFVLNTKRHSGGGYGDGVVETTTDLADYDGSGGDAECYDSGFDSITLSYDITFDGPYNRTDPTANYNGCPFCGTYRFR